MAFHVSTCELLSVFKIPFVPQKISFDPNCEFFEEGNRFCRPLEKQLIVEEDCGEDPQTVPRFVCTEPNCEHTFNCLQSCEVHYACAHRYVCIECKRVLPSQPMLDLHIQDNHRHSLPTVDCENDLYACFIVLCAKRFSSLEERNEHLINDHKYPPNFKFGMLRSKKILGPERMDTSSPSDNVSYAKYKPKVPHNICFGRGRSKVFNRGVRSFSHARNRASCPNQKPELGSDICMAELHDVLP